MSTIEENIHPYYERMPDEERDMTQAKVIEQLIGKDASIETQLRWVDEKAKTLGKEISDIIDDTRNVQIRGLLASHQYDKAAEEIISLLRFKKAI